MGKSAKICRIPTTKSFTKVTATGGSVKKKELPKSKVSASDAAAAARAAAARAAAVAKKPAKPLAKA